MLWRPGLVGPPLVLEFPFIYNLDVWEISLCMCPPIIPLFSSDGDVYWLVEN